MSELVRSLSSDTPPKYYSSFKARPHLQDAFRNIDEANNLKTYLALLKDAQTRNFVLDFGNDDAWCAVNLDQEDLALLLREPVRLKYNCV